MTKPDERFKSRLPHIPLHQYAGEKKKKKTTIVVAPSRKYAYHVPVLQQRIEETKAELTVRIMVDDTVLKKEFTKEKGYETNEEPSSDETKHRKPSVCMKRQWKRKSRDFSQ